MFRPWPADDGALVRLRLAGGLISTRTLAGLSALAIEHGDGDIHLTSRANLQLRALPHADDTIPAEVVGGLEALGLLPSRTHELVRNLVVSPQTGLAGGRADLRALADEFDRRLCADPDLARLSARFLVVLDDGRGDVITQRSDLALIALDATTAQLQVGDAWAAVVPLDGAVDRLLALARAFVAARGTGPGAAWHVRELDRSLSDPAAEPTAADPRALVTQPPLAYGSVTGGEHVPTPDGRLSPALVRTLTEPLAPEHALVVTPWRGVLVPTPEGDR